MKTKNKFNTPFMELYPTFQDYQRHEAQQRLDMPELYYMNAYYKHVDLLAMSDGDIAMHHLEEEKQKALDNRAYLKKCIDGEVVDLIYLAYYNQLSKSA